VPPLPGRQAYSEPPDPRLLRRRGSGSFQVPGSGPMPRRCPGMQARRTEAETFRAAPSGRRILAADGCASSLSNPAACCFCAVSAPGGPRGVAVAMFGHTGLGMLICR
jgi:hypothetical protein